MSMLLFSELPPLGLYLHFPWCVKKCPYCDFNSHALKDPLPEKVYIDALLNDLDQELPLIWGRPVQSIFMGGGTPSLFSPEGLDRLLSGLRARLNYSPSTEITLEANPGTVEQGRFQEYHDIGINRLSIGLQSFNDDFLQKLGRIHNAREAIRAAEIAHKSGLENFNLDLMYGLPGQSTQAALKDIQQATSLEPAHVSHYQLTIEPNTWFYHHPPSTPDEDLISDMEQDCRSTLAKAGFQQYEISAFAQETRQCQHNLNYWLFGDYLGIGAGAHGKRSDAQQQQIVRSWKVKHPQEYMTQAHCELRIGGQQQLDTKNIAFEFMLNALRLTQGFATELFAQRCGMPISSLEKQLLLAQDKGLIDWQLKHICPTERGRRYLNDLLELFLPEPDTNE